jgi:regulator of sirC expression with transglutaminase-like and TPR domain
MRANVPEPNPAKYGPTVPPTEEFRALVSGPEHDLALDRAALLIAAHAHPGLDVAARLGELDRLADESHAEDAATLARFLFEERGFAGNSVDYGDPRNSLFDDVLDRRLGIPITLSVLMMTVGARRGVPLHGVGMPGHFLVGTDGTEFFDPFHRGVRLDVAGCGARFAEMHPAADFDPAFLQPVGARTIVERMLVNLQHGFLRRDPAAAAWVVALRLMLPTVTVASRVELAGVLGRIGRFDAAASLLEGVAGEVTDGRDAQLRRTATRLRSRLN